MCVQCASARSSTTVTFSNRIGYTHSRSHRRINADSSEPRPKPGRRPRNGTVATLTFPAFASRGPGKSPVPQSICFWRERELIPQKTSRCWGWRRHHSGRLPPRGHRSSVATNFWLCALVSVLLPTRGPVRLIYASSLALQASLSNSRKSPAQRHEPCFYLRPGEIVQPSRQHTMFGFSLGFPNKI